jgi:ABC-type branched-subunit amino acid transport system ATPase component
MSSRNLCKSFGGNQVLKSVDFDLHEGEVVLLRGDNGSGKTTLLNILTGNLEPEAGLVRLDADGSAENFDFPRAWWRDLNPFDHFTPERVANEAAGRTWQDIRLFSTQTLADNIAVATPRQAGESPFRAIFQRRRVRLAEGTNRSESVKLLSGLGLGQRADSSADKISLGQTKRVAIARAVRAGARILFLDEPLAGLDSKGIEEVMALLTDLARNEKVTLVIIEHVFNIPRVLDLAHTVWSLRDGCITSETPEKVRDEMREAAGDGVMHLLRSIADAPTEQEIRLFGGAVLTRLQRGDTKNLTAVLEIKDLVVRRGSRLVIGEESADGSVIGLNLALYAGDLAILQAPNGWGKTTLLEALCGLIPIERGEIRFQGRPIQNLPPWERIQLGLSVLQARNHHFDNLTVAETFALAGQSMKTSKMVPYSERKVSSLSGGEIQRVMVGMLRNTTFSIYDEPFASLDLDGKNLWTMVWKELCISMKNPVVLVFIPSAHY